MFIVREYRMPPGACVLCGKRNLPAVDLQMETWDNRQVVVCASCIGEMATKLGVGTLPGETVTVERAPTDEEIAAYVRRQLGVPEAPQSPVTCPTCGREFSTQQGLAGHVRHCVGPGPKP